MSCAIPLGKLRFRSELDSSSHPVRLFREFNEQHSLPMIADVVHACLTDLEGQVPPGALAELLERSARQRLTST